MYNYYNQNPYYNMPPVIYNNGLKVILMVLF